MDERAKFYMDLNTEISKQAEQDFCVAFDKIYANVEDLDADLNSSFIGFLVVIKRVTEEMPPKTGKELWDAAIRSLCMEGLANPSKYIK